MSVGSSIKAGAAYVELFLRDNRLTKGLAAASKRLKSFGASAASVGRQMAMVGAVAAAPFALSTKTFAGFEQAMARVQALTGANAVDFQRLTDEAKQLGASTVFAASQAAEAMSIFALAGYDVDKILKATNPTLQLAAAGQIEIAQAADIATKIMSGMGIATERLGEVIDIMAKAMTTANTDMLMLGDAFKFVGPIAKSAGLQIEEITAAVQLLSNAGMQGEMAGTVLRGMILALTSPSSQAADVIQRLGVRVSDAAGNMRPLADILRDLENATSSMGSADRLQVLGTIFPARQAAGAAELVSQGADALERATAALQGAAGTSGKIAGRQLDTLSGDVTILRSALEGLAISIGEAVAPALRKIVQAFQLAINYVSTFVQENQALIFGIAAGAAALVAGGAALVAVGLAASGLGVVFGGIVTIFGLVASAIGLVGTVIGFLLSPIGLVVAAVVGLGIYFIRATGAIGTATSWLAEKFGTLQSDALSAFDGIKNALAAGDFALAAEIAWTSMQLVWQRGINTIQGWWIEFKSFFQRVWAEAVMGAARIFVNAWAGVQTAWNETVGFLSDVWTIFWSGLTKLVHHDIAILKKAWIGLKSLFDSGIDTTAEFARIDAERDAKLRGVDEQRDKTIGDRDAARRQRAQEIKQQQADTLAELERERRQDEISKSSGDQQAALQQKLDELIRKRDEALARANSGQEEASGPDEDSLDTLAEELRSATSATAIGMTGLGGSRVEGTFSTAAAARMGGGEDYAAETARNTRQANRHLKNIDKANKRRGPITT